MEARSFPETYISFLGRSAGGRHLPSHAGEDGDVGPVLEGCLDRIPTCWDAPAPAADVLKEGDLQSHMGHGNAQASCHGATAKLLECLWRRAEKLASKRHGAVGVAAE